MRRVLTTTLGLVQGALIILKLTGYIGLSWFEVFIPLFLWFAIDAVILAPFAWKLYREWKSMKLGS